MSFAQKVFELSVLLLVLLKLALAAASTSSGCLNTVEKVCCMCPFLCGFRLAAKLVF